MQGEHVGEEMAAGLALCQASEQIDGKIAEIESLLMTLALAHRRDAATTTDREPASTEMP